MNRDREVLFYVGRGVHPIYREQLGTAPSGFRYLPSHPALVGEETVKEGIARRGEVRDQLRRNLTALGVTGLSRLGFVRRVPLVPPSSVDLIHSAQYLLRGSRTPWVVDFEDFHVFTMYQPGALRWSHARRRLVETLSEEKFQFLLPWTDAARRGALTAMDRHADLLERRLVTVRPAVKPRRSQPRSHGSPFKVLFVGSAFYPKGGVEAIRAIRILRQAHDVELDLVTFLPTEERRTLPNESGLQVHSKVSPQELERLFEEAHALLFPAHTDTLGFVVLEAMARALPVVASTHFALPEIVRDEQSGLLFPHENSLYGPDAVARFRWFRPTRLPRRFLDCLRKPSPDYVDGIVASLRRLIDDAQLYGRLSRGALLQTTSGALSPAVRSEQLRDIYEAAVA